MYRRFGKRLFDVTIALVGLVVLTPVLALVALFIRIGMGAPVLFRQQRPGLGGRPFVLVKFRTMTHGVMATGVPLTDAQRLTTLGRFLRKTSLDELPELWNVLVGEMSLVGPRPLLMKYLPLYSPEQRRRHDVRPGITGLAQISGRNDLPWEERFALDVRYTQTLSWLLDLRILLTTLWRVLSMHGVSQLGRATVDEFQGQAE